MSLASSKRTCNCRCTARARARGASLDVSVVLKRRRLDVAVGVGGGGFARELYFAQLLARLNETGGGTEQQVMTSLRHIVEFVDYVSLARGNP